MQYKLPRQTEANTFPCCALLYKITDLEYNLEMKKLSTNPNTYSPYDYHEHSKAYCIYGFYLNDEFYLLKCDFNATSTRHDIIILTSYGEIQIGPYLNRIMEMNKDINEMTMFFDENPNIKDNDLNDKLNPVYAKKFIIFPEKIYKFILHLIDNYRYNDINKKIESKTLEIIKNFNFQNTTDSETESDSYDSETESDSEIKQEVSDSTPTPLDNTPTPRDNTPTPRDNTPTPLDNTPTPLDNMPTPRDNTPTPRDNTPDYDIMEYCTYDNAVYNLDKILEPFTAKNFIITFIIVLLIERLIY